MGNFGQQARQIIIVRQIKLGIDSREVKPKICDKPRKLTRMLGSIVSRAISIKTGGFFNQHLKKYPEWLPQNEASH